MNWPFSALQAEALSTVESLLNKAVSYDPMAQGAIAGLSGKVLAIESSFPPLTLFVSHSEHGLGLHANWDQTPTTHLKGSAVAMIAMALSMDKQTSFAGSGVELTGDQELLGDIQAILSNLDVDWQTALAQLVGDVPASIISQTLRSSHQWGEKARVRAANVAADFVKEEAQFSPTPDEVEAWASDIRKLRADADRVQARVDQLIQRFKSDSTKGEQA